jgi:hypothetical protein
MPNIPDAVPTTAANTGEPAIQATDSESVAYADPVVRDLLEAVTLLETLCLDSVRLPTNVPYELLHGAKRHLDRQLRAHFTA